MKRLFDTIGGFRGHSSESRNPKRKDLNQAGFLVKYGITECIKQKINVPAKP